MKKIGYRAFYQCTALRYGSEEGGILRLPESLSEIGGEAFCGCKGIEDIMLPEHLKSLGDGVFTDCTNLWRNNPDPFKLPESIEFFGKYVFMNCRYLHRVDFPKGRPIEEGTFWGCIQITNDDFYHIIEGAPEIGAYAFQNCKKISGDIRFPEGTKLHRGILWDCPKVSSVSLPGADCPIDMEVCISPLTRCTNAKLRIPDGVTSIGDGAFRGRSGLREVEIPDGVTSIGDSAFDGCSGLKEIKLPDSVTSIGFRAFAGCSALRFFVSRDLEKWNRIKDEVGKYGRPVYFR